MGIITIIRKMSSIFINDKEVKSKETIKIGDLKIEVCDTNVNITVEGNVHGNVESISGDITVAKDVMGDVSTISGDIKIRAIAGNVNSVYGDVESELIEGCVETVSGDVNAGTIRGGITF